MPHLQIAPDTEHAAHRIARYATQLQAAHEAAKARAAKIASRERGVISIYALGEEIARIEEQIAEAGQRLDVTAAAALYTAATRLKALIPMF